MRAGMQSLLDVLRGAASPAAIAEPEWAAMLNIASEENVVRWAVKCLCARKDELTSQRAEHLEEIGRQARFSAFLWSSTLKSTLAAFHRAGLPVISLKGPWLAERLYGDSALRSCRDLDLLVRQSDLRQAEDLLSELGFLPDGRRDDYHRPWRRDCIVELHHNVENPLAFDLGMEDVWTRAQLAQFNGVPARLLAPADELLFLCLHAVRHRFDRLSLALDLTFALRRLPLPDRSAAEFDNLLALGSMMAAHLDPEIPVPEHMYRRLQDRERLEQIADQLWRERMSEPCSALDWRAQHNFYLEVETPGWKRVFRRWRHFRILLTRLIDPDFDFAARFNLRRTWQVRLLRPIRLLLRGPRASPSSP